METDVDALVILQQDGIHVISAEGDNPQYDGATAVGA